MGLSNRLLVDHGSQLGKSQIFASLAATSNVELQTTGIQAHSSLGISERYHQPIFNNFRKLKISNPKQDNNLLLQFAIKGMNDNLGSEGIIPSLFVFGEYPQAFTTSESRPSRYLQMLTSYPEDLCYPLSPLKMESSNTRRDL